MKCQETKTKVLMGDREEGTLRAFESFMERLEQLYVRIKEQSGMPISSQVFLLGQLNE